jgi:serine/threonine protein kinase
MQQQYGKYRILEEVGRGAYATVYKARNPDLDRFVAVKVPYQNFHHHDDEYLRLFTREARIAARLDHPNIVRVYDFEAEGPDTFIVMEFVPEGLDRLFRGGKALPVKRAVEIAVQVCEGLAHAHDQGVIHRDVKPSNILLTTNGEAKVADFGIARAAEYATRWTTSIRGTPLYMAPEQTKGDEPDQRADVYATGITVYEMLTGRLPFEPEGYGDAHGGNLLRMHESTPVPSMPIALGIPRELEAVVRRALAKKPRDRFQSMAEMASALTEAVKEPPKPTPSPRPEPPPPKSPPTPGPSVPTPAGAPGPPGSAPPRPPRQRGGNDRGSWFRRNAGIVFAVGIVFMFVFLVGPGLLDLWQKEELTAYDYLKAGDYEKALDNYDQAIKLSPSDSTAYNNRGFAYASLGMYELAIQDYDEAVKLNPQSFNAYNHRAIAYARLG